MDDFDDIFGGIPSTTTTKPPDELFDEASSPKAAIADDPFEQENEETRQPVKSSASTDLDSFLSSVDDAMQSSAAAKTDEDFSDIFGDSPAKQGGGAAKKGADKTKFRSAYEKDDFMGWLKDEGEGEALSPAHKGRAASLCADDFGDIFGLGVRMSRLLTTSTNIFFEI